MSRGTGSEGFETRSLWMIVLTFSYWKRRGDTYQHQPHQELQKDSTVSGRVKTRCLIT